MHRLLPLSLLALVLVTSCRSPTYPELNDTFNGLLAPQGVAWHQFVVQHPGDLSITVTKFDPLTTVTFGVGVGVVDTTTNTCAVTSSAVGQLNVTGLLSVAPGTYCVQLSDTGNVTQQVSYTIFLRHFWKLTLAVPGFRGSEVPRFEVPSSEVPEFSS